MDFTEARDSEWQWHHLGHMQVCISFQTDNHASTPPLSFLQAGCPSCRPAVMPVSANGLGISLGFYQGPDLQNILRQSYDYLTIMPKLRSTYDERVIYKTSHEGRKAFLRYDSLAKL